MVSLIANGNSDGFGMILYNRSKDLVDDRAQADAPIYIYTLDLKDEFPVYIDGSSFVPHDFKFLQNSLFKLIFNIFLFKKKL